jgi:hypothetical protein
LKNPEKIPEFFEYAIHTLYAVVVGLSFDMSSLIVIPLEKISDHLTNAFVLLLGYTLLISSWFGYYSSIKKHPHRGKLGFFRFIIDIFSLFLFYYLLALSKVTLEKANTAFINDVFLTLPIIYGTYFIWDIVKYFEYKKKKSK